jgi:hypothetical protein
MTVEFTKSPMTFGQYIALERWSREHEWEALRYLILKRTTLTADEVDDLVFDDSFIELLRQMMASLKQALDLKSLEQQLYDIDLSLEEDE